MGLTKALPISPASTNRLADVFHRLEQGQPLAVRLGGSGTTGHAFVTDDPRSTWGFDLLGHLQKPAGSKTCFSNYVTLMVTLIAKWKHLNVSECCL